MKSNASKYLKTGGILVYSTCTNVYAEHEGIINKFLTDYKEFRIDKITNIPEEFAQYVYNEGMLELSPEQNDCDGFFICKLKKG